MVSKEDFRVVTGRDALSLMSKLVYNEFGAESLPVIREVWGELGKAVGEEMRKDLPEHDLKVVADVFAATAARRGNPIDILELSGTVFHFRGYKCNLGFKGAGRELCQAAMQMDLEMLHVVMEKKLKLEIMKTIAANDDCCEMVYSVIGSSVCEKR